MLLIPKSATYVQGQWKGQIPLLLKENHSIGPATVLAPIQLMYYQRIFVYIFKKIHLSNNYSYSLFIAHSKVIPLWRSLNKYKESMPKEGTHSLIETILLSLTYLFFTQKSAKLVYIPDLSTTP